MRLKLQENPREWQKFATVMMVLVGGLATVGWRRGLYPREVWLGLLGAAILVAAIAWVWPKPFRGFYRTGMTISHRIGLVMGTVLLTVFFLVVVTPLGLALRLLGKDLLQLRRRPNAESYWQPAKTSDKFERQF